MIDNFVVFIPFGLFLGINLKKASFWRKLAYISIFSLGVEILQFIFAIGITDITDIITNTLGGLVGLLVYDLGKKYIDNKKLDLFITILSAILIAALLLLRIFILKVKY
jgi:glycopeptide antibiotics resistance protein